MEKRDSKEYRSVLEETLEDANALMQTFSALLEIAQAEAGSFRGEWKVVDLSAMLEELGGLYLDEAEARHNQFELQIEPNLKITGNRHLLAQAISNLLDNAFKYTPDGSTIRLQAAMQAGSLSLTVSDNGPGIAVDQRDKVFQRFVRLEPDRSTAGNGLGLSLVKAVADLHKAELRLEDNQPGLRVVLLHGRAPAPPQTPPPAHGKRLRTGDLPLRPLFSEAGVVDDCENAEILMII